MSLKPINSIGDKQRTKKIIFFGTDGIRGKADSLFSNGFVRKIGFLTSEVLPSKGPVIIGQDSRISSHRIARALTSGLYFCDREVWLIGLCPTPAVPYLIKKYHASGGLMISASHNAPEDNGIKIFDANGEKISLAKQQIIEKGLQEEKLLTQSKGKYVDRSELLKDYADNLLKITELESLNDTSITLDLCWGSATSCAESIFQSLGAKISTINSKPDGKKINVKCGSTCLKEIQKEVIKNQSDMGFAFDGDADRVIAVDRKGRVLDGDHILYLWGSDLKDQNSLYEQRLVSTTMSNLGFEKAWLNKGGLLERTPVGDKYVHEAMVNSKASLGGEQSGHILSTLNGLCGDGLLTALQLSKICISKEITLEELLNQSFEAYPQKLINIPIRKDINNESLIQSKRFQKSISQAELALGNEGRVFIRKSGTEAVLRVMIESRDNLLVEQWISIISKIAFEEFT